MEAKREYRDRPATEVAVLDALVDRRGEGMTVLEVRARVEADIDEVEAALTSLKDDGLIAADQEGGRTLIRVDDAVVPRESPVVERSIVDRLRDRFL